MKQAICGALLIGALAICGSLPSCQANGRATAPEAFGGERPEMAQAIEAILDRTPLLLLGEIHGTNEAPAFALETAEFALALGHRAALGIEMSAIDMAEIDRYLASGGAASDREEVLASPYWEFTAMDGRGSLAMLELFEGVRAINASGRCLPVVGFVPDEPQPSLEAYERSMAEALLDALGRDDITHLIVLTGSLHAQSRDGRGKLVPMGGFLRKVIPNMVSLDLRSAGGFAWNWAGTIGVHSVAGSGDPDAYGIELSDAPDELGFDGVFDVGTVSASSPVRPEAVLRFLQREQ